MDHTTLRYRSDFLVKLGENLTPLIEGKGRPDEKDDAKKTAAARWVAAVNDWGKLGRWDICVCFRRSEVGQAISRFLADAAGH